MIKEILQHIEDNNLNLVHVASNREYIDRYLMHYKYPIALTLLHIFTINLEKHSSELYDIKFTLKNEKEIMIITIKNDLVRTMKFPNDGTDNMPKV